MQAQLGIGRDSAGVVVWEPVGPEFMLAVRSWDYAPEADWTSDLPPVAYDVLIYLAKILGTTRHVDLGPALGDMTAAESAT